MQLKKILKLCILLLLVALVVVVVILASKGSLTPPPASDIENVPPAQTVPTEEVSAGPEDPEEGMPDLDDDLPEGLSDADLQTRIDAMTIVTATGTRPLTSEEKQAVTEDYR